MDKSQEQGSVTARALAATAVNAVLADGRSLDAALLKLGIADLDEGTRAMTRALAFGTLRTQFRNQRLLELLVERPFRRRDSVVAALISTGLYALADARKPDYAVVSSTVDAVARLGKPRMRGVVNAVLRRYLRERESLLTEVDQSAEAHWQHPDWLIGMIRDDWPQHWEAVLTANNTQAPMCLRINKLQITRDAWLQQLADSGVATGTAVPGFAAAVLLGQPVSVTRLPGFVAGAVSVQDAASQLAAPLLDVGPGMRVLDACAAPGGKTTHVLETAPELAELVAVEESETRLARIRENLERLGLQATIVQGDAADPAGWWDGQLFDRILLDAPCSATGVIRRHPDIRFLRRADDVPALATQQLRLLESLWPLLKPGGRLLYSTCSVLRAENDAVIAAMLARTTTATSVPLAAGMEGQGLLPTEYGRQLLPGAAPGGSSANTDGFYYALMAREPIA